MSAASRVALAVLATALPGQAAAQVVTEGALSGWTVVDWMGTRESKPLPGGPTVVLADQIEMKGATSQGHRNPPRVFIAEHIRVTGPARVDASNLGAGNDVAIVARRLTCDGGTLEVDVSGRGVVAHGRDRPGRSYRDLETRDPQKCHDACLLEDRCQSWSFGLPPEAATAVARLRCFLKEAAFPEVRTPGMASGMRPAPGRITVAVEREEPAGGCIIAKGTTPTGISRMVGPDAFQRFLATAQTLSRPQREKIASLWVIRWLAFQETLVKEAVARPDYRQAVALLAGARTLADSRRYPIAPEDRAAFGRALQDLDESGRRVPAFVIESMPVTTASGERNVDVWLETRTATAYVPPSILVVEPFSHAGKSGLAYLSFDAARPEQLVIQVNARLAQDPALKQELGRALAEKGLKQGGVLSTWRYKAEIAPVFGVREQKLVQSGDVLELGLTLDAAQGNVALSRLAASGLTVELQVSSGDSTSTTVRLPLSLARVSHLPGLAIVAGALQNKGAWPVRVAYLEMADGAVRALPRSLEVPAGQSASLPAGFEHARGVPIAGAEYQLVPQRLLDYVVAADASPLVDTITVTNLLGPDPARGGVLEYVEVDVEYTSGGGPPVRVDSVRLASRGAMDSERRLSFVRAPGDRKVRIEGRAYYEGGSSQAIGPVTFSSSAVKITEESFPAS